MRIEILDASQVTRPYRIVGIATQQHFDPNEALVRMRVEALALGGDALLGLEERAQTGSKVVAMPIGGNVYVRERPTSEPSVWIARVIAWTDKNPAEAEPAERARNQ